MLLSGSHGPPPANPPLANRNPAPLRLRNDSHHKKAPNPPDQHKHGSIRGPATSARHRPSHRRKNPANPQIVRLLQNGGRSALHPRHRPKASGKNAQIPDCWKAWRQPARTACSAKLSQTRSLRKLRESCTHGKVTGFATPGETIRQETTRRARCQRRRRAGIAIVLNLRI